ncbi:hypothetical protein C0991_012273 [Blastosporella zonata]|nr:hypothetical protein C0991_012273 [Blastosporella zonata]
MQEIMQLQQELSGSGVCTSCDEPEVNLMTFVDGLVPETDFEGLNEETEPSNSDLDDFRGSSQLAMGSKLEYGQEHQCWSHTVPQRPTSAPLTRTHTSSSVRFDALERAYTAVANAESQTPVEDLVHASGLVNRIQSALTEQLTRRLAKSEPGDGR